MKRQELRNILVSAGVENPSKDLIDTLLDSFNEESSGVKTALENEKTELQTKVDDLTKQIETLKNDPEKVAKSEYDKVISEKTELENKIKVEGKKAIVRKYKGDEDFLDTILNKVDAGKDDKEFETNVEKFLKENPKFTDQKVIVNSNTNPNGKDPSGTEKVDMANAIANHYSVSK